MRKYFSQLRIPAAAEFLSSSSLMEFLGITFIGRFLMGKLESIRWCTGIGSSGKTTEESGNLHFGGSGRMTEVVGHFDSDLTTSSWMIDEWFYSITRMIARYYVEAVKINDTEVYASWIMFSPIREVISEWYLKFSIAKLASASQRSFPIEAMHFSRAFIILVSRYKFIIAPTSTMRRGAKPKEKYQILHMKSIQCWVNEKYIHPNISCFAKTFNALLSTINIIGTAKVPVWKILVS